MFIGEYNLWLSNYLHTSTFGSARRRAITTQCHILLLLCLYCFVMLCFFFITEVVFFFGCKLHQLCVWNNMLLIHIVSLVLRNQCCSVISQWQPKIFFSRISRILKIQSNPMKIGQSHFVVVERKEKNNNVLWNDSIRMICFIPFVFNIFEKKKVFVGGILFWKWMKWNEKIIKNLITPKQLHTNQNEIMPLIIARASVDCWCCC